MRYKNIEVTVYKGDNVVAFGSIQECATKLSVTPEYIYWLLTPSAARRQEKRKKPDEVMVAVRI